MHALVQHGVEEAVEALLVASHHLGMGFGAARREVKAEHAAYGMGAEFDARSCRFPLGGRALRATTEDRADVRADRSWMC